MSPPTAAARRPAGADDGPTLGEIGRLLEAMRTDTGSRLDKIDAKLAGLDQTYVRRDLYDATERSRDVYIKGLEERIVGLEGTQQWLFRLVGGGLVSAVIAGLFAARNVIGG